MKSKKFTDPRVTSTPYDATFRTLVNDAKDLLIPLLNEVFDEHFTGEEEIVPLPNEHFLNRQDGDTKERITDTTFKVIGKTTKIFHLECETTDDATILIRIVEYDTQIALDQGSQVTRNKIVISMPNSAVIFLRSRPSTPDVMQIEIQTPGGTVSYSVPVLKIKDYSLQTIFEKKLYFLLPFYLFNYEQELEEIDRDPERLQELYEEFVEIKSHLTEQVEKAEMKAITSKVISDLTAKVVVNLAKDQENIRKGVEPVMVGKVIELEAVQIYDEGKEEGKRLGREEGERLGIEKGERAGLLRGREEGERAGSEKSLSLANWLIKNGRIDDVSRAAEDPAFRSKLLEEFESQIR